MVQAQPFEVIYEKSATGSEAQISVLISCYKYGKEATEALASVQKQTEPKINVVLVDDHSPDDSVPVLKEWFARHGGDDKLEKITFVRHLKNHRASQARNTALSLVSTPYTFVLDADNQLFPRALKTLREALEASGYAMSYSLVQKFGAEQSIMNNSLWIPERFSYGNYIDALALVRTDILQELGGYRQMPKNNYGWEDYDLWCSFVDKGLKGCHVPQILCRYQVHEGSVTQTSAKEFTQYNMEAVQKDFEAHHSMPFYLASKPPSS